METETSDIALVDLLRKRGPLSVAELEISMQVTATAVRQRLTRLLGARDIERTTHRAGRGRPVHRYQLTEKGRRRAGNNFADLAMVLWQEVREIKDPEIRRGLLQRLGRRLAESYKSEVVGESVEQRMQALAALFRERQIPFEVELAAPHHLPTIHAHACPYPELAEQDRTVCSMEKMLFSELVGTSLHLASCRLDGDSCCTFEPTTSGPLAATP
jgi:DeoR family transcriptional regulator, suf operon transcriptional repressor